MKQYLNLAYQVLTEGEKEDNRTGIRATSLFGSQMRFDISNGKLALVTTKKLHLKSIVHELLWMISGDTNTKYLKDNGVRIWDEWADAEGNLGPVYGAQWRNWLVTRKHGMGFATYGVDQLANVIERLKTDPTDRRLIVSAWNVAALDDMALPPCHMMFQLKSKPAKVEGGKRRLSLQIYQRSVDVFLGLPFNLAFYSLLTHMIAAQTGHEADELIHVGGDVHVYENHEDQMQTQLEREVMDCVPRVVLAKKESLFDYTFEDIQIVGYKSHPALRGKVAV